MQQLLALQPQPALPWRQHGWPLPLRRGTLSVDREVPVGFGEIRLRFELSSDASEEQLQTLLRLTERYCVVFQTLASPPSLSVSAP